MLNSLDLLIIVFMVLAVVSLLSLSLMYLIRNKKVKEVCFYIVAALGIYFCYVGSQILLPGFPGQFAISAVMGALSVSSIILHCKNKDDEQKFLIARIMATVALIGGAIAAFV